MRKNKQKIVSLHQKNISTTLSSEKEGEPSVYLEQSLDAEGFCVEANKLLEGYGTSIGTKSSTVKKIIKKLSNEATIHSTKDIGNNFHVFRINIPKFNSLFLVIEQEWGRIGIGRFLTYDQAFDQLWNQLTDVEFSNFFDVDWVEKIDSLNSPKDFASSNKFQKAYKEKFQTLADEQLHIDATSYLAAIDPRATIQRSYDKFASATASPLYEVTTPLFEEKLYFNWTLYHFYDGSSASVDISWFTPLEYFFLYVIDDLDVIRWLHRAQ